MSRDFTSAARAAEGRGRACVRGASTQSRPHAPCHPAYLEIDSLVRNSFSLGASLFSPHLPLPRPRGWACPVLGAPGTWGCRAAPDVNRRAGPHSRPCSHRQRHPPNAPPDFGSPPLDRVNRGSAQHAAEHGPRHIANRHHHQCSGQAHGHPGPVSARKTRVPLSGD